MALNTLAKYPIKIKVQEDNKYVSVFSKAF